MSGKGSDIQRLIAEDTDRLVENLIHEGTITKPSWWMSQPGGFVILGIVLIICCAFSIMYQFWLYEQNTNSNMTSNSKSMVAFLPNGAQVATALIAAVAGVFAYHQWTDTRREISLEKFYDRLKLVNERYYVWDEARAIVSHFWGEKSDVGEFRRRMYVYLELDNLEYMIFRYQLGFVRKPLFRRAVRTFVSRCESKEFCDLSLELVKGAGYSAKTVQIVNALLGQKNISNLKEEIKQSSWYLSQTF